MAVDLPSSPLGEVDPQFEKVALEVAAFTFGLPGTSVREKLLQNLTLDICRSHLGLAFRMHVTAARLHGLGYGDVLAAIRFIAPYSGYPAAADAFARLKEVAGEIGMDTSDLGGSAAGGVVDVERFETPDEWSSKFLDWQVARAWSEERLSVRERAIMALTSDVGLGVFDESFRGHVRLALDVGLSADEVRDVVRFCGEYGVGRGAAAVRELEGELSA